MIISERSVPLISSPVGALPLKTTISLAASAAAEPVPAVAAREQVVAGTAFQAIGPGTAIEHIVAVFAIRLSRIRVVVIGVRITAEIERVVAGAAEDGVLACAAASQYVIR